MSFLGIARKAGALVFGGKACEEAILQRRAKLIVLAGDAGGSAKRNFHHLAQKYEVEIISCENKTRLGFLIGLEEAAVIVITNTDFVSNVKKALNFGGE